VTWIEVLALLAVAGFLVMAVVMAVEVIGRRRRLARHRAAVDRIKYGARRRPVDEEGQR